jgi:hypothetical protein
MTIPSFGIPEGEANLDLVAQQSTSNRQQLAEIQRALGQPLFEQLQTNDQLISPIWHKLRSTLRGRITGNNYHLNAIDQTIRSHLQGQIAANRDLLSVMPPPKTGSSKAIFTHQVTSPTSGKSSGCQCLWYGDIYAVADWAKAESLAPQVCHHNGPFVRVATYITDNGPPECRTFRVYEFEYLDPSVPGGVALCAVGECPQKKGDSSGQPTPSPPPATTSPPESCPPTPTQVCCPVAPRFTAYCKADKSGGYILPIDQQPQDALDIAIGTFEDEGSANNALQLICPQQPQAEQPPTEQAQPPQEEQQFEQLFIPPAPTSGGICNRLNQLEVTLLELGSQIRSGESLDRTMLFQIASLFSPNINLSYAAAGYMDDAVKKVQTSLATNSIPGMWQNVVRDFAPDAVERLYNLMAIRQVLAFAEEASIHFGEHGQVSSGEGISGELGAGV